MLTLGKCLVICALNCTSQLSLRQFCLCVFSLSLYNPRSQFYLLSNSSASFPKVKLANTLSSVLWTGNPIYVQTMLLLTSCQQNPFGDGGKEGKEWQVPIDSKAHDFFFFLTWLSPVHNCHLGFAWLLFPFFQLAFISHIIMWSAACRDTLPLSEQNCAVCTCSLKGLGWGNILKRLES